MAAVDQLEGAGLIDSRELTQAQADAVNSLSDDEVKALISAKDKLGFKGTLNRSAGPGPAGGDDGGADFF